MTNAANIIAAPAAISASRNFQEMSIVDLTMIVDLLTSARVTARATGCLANHMQRDALEEFADAFVVSIDDRLTEIQAEALYRVSGGEIEAAAIADLSAQLGAILSPREGGVHG